MSRFGAFAFAVLMLVFNILFLNSFISNQALYEDVAEIKNDISIEVGKTRKQQAEYDQYTGELPEVLAQLETLTPEAEAAMAAVEEMKAERKALRKQIKLDQQALAEVIPADLSEMAQKINALEQQAQSLEEQIAALQAQ